MPRGILLIINSAETRENVQEILELYGYKVIAVSDIETGLHIAHIIKPKIIIADQPLKEKDKVAMQKHGLPTVNGRHLPFLMIATSIVHQTNKIKHKAVRFLVKPFDVNFLMETISHYYSRKHK